jgi:hypothetical protein
LSSIAIRIAEQLRQPRDVDGYAAGLVAMGKVVERWDEK